MLEEALNKITFCINDVFLGEVATTTWTFLAFKTLLSTMSRLRVEFQPELILGDCRLLLLYSYGTWELVGSQVVRVLLRTIRTLAEGQLYKTSIRICS